MAKVVCVLYDDPVTGYPKEYPRDSLPKLEKYPDGQTLPSPKGIDFKPGALLGSVSGELGLRPFLEKLGHKLVVTSDKDGENSTLDKELADAEIVISQPFWPAYLTAERIAEEVAKLSVTAGAGLRDPRAEVSFEMRYRGQAFELPVAGSSTSEPDELAERFADEHERRYGYREPAGEVELVNVRLALSVAGPAPRPQAAPPGRLERAERRARFDGEWLTTEVLIGEPSAGTEALGPCVFELGEATFVLPPGWRAECDEHGTIAAGRTR